MKKTFLFIIIIITSIQLFAQQTVTIGSQVWMNEDLKVTHFRNGDPISEAKNNVEWVRYAEAQQPCYRKISNGAYIYNGYAMIDERGIAPEGFKVPAKSDFMKLFKHIDARPHEYGFDNHKAIAKLITYSYALDDFENDTTIIIAGNNSLKFNARPGGFAYGEEHGNADKGYCTFWWTSTSTEYDYEYFETGRMVTRYISVSIGYCSNALGGIMNNSLDMGFSIRCIKE